MDNVLKIFCKFLNRVFGCRTCQLGREGGVLVGAGLFGGGSGAAQKDLAIWLAVGHELNP